MNQKVVKHIFSLNEIMFTIRFSGETRSIKSLLNGDFFLSIPAHFLSSSFLFPSSKGGIATCIISPL